MSSQPVFRMVNFGDEQGSTFPLVRDDATYDMYEDPGPGNFALEIIVDRDGIVQFAKHGATTAELERVITSLL